MSILWRSWITFTAIIATVLIVMTTAKKLDMFPSVEILQIAETVE